MNIEEALKVLSDVCAGYRGNLQEHHTLQEALRVVREACKKEEPAETE